MPPKHNPRKESAPSLKKMGIGKTSNARYIAAYNEAPPQFLCPIAQTLMEDPVMADDGCIYERQAITKWFKQCQKYRWNLRSPTTNEPIYSTNLNPQATLRTRIMDYVRKNPSVTVDFGVGMEDESYTKSLYRSTAAQGKVESLYDTHFSVLDSR